MPPTDITQSPGFQLWQSSIRWQHEQQKALAPYDLNYCQYVMLAFLVFQMNWRAMNQRQLYRKLDMHKMTASKALKALETKQFLRLNQYGFFDGRAVSVWATTRGVLVVKQASEAVASVDDQFFQKQERAPF
jgi:DNA-binding MarR family transcriptional regulator